MSESKKNYHASFSESFVYWEPDLVLTLTQILFSGITRVLAEPLLAHIQGKRLSKSWTGHRDKVRRVDLNSQNSIRLVFFSFEQKLIFLGKHPPDSNDDALVNYLTIGKDRSISRDKSVSRLTWTLSQLL